VRVGRITKSTYVPGFVKVPLPNKNQVDATIKIGLLKMPNGSQVCARCFYFTIKLMLRISKNHFKKRFFDICPKVRIRALRQSWRANTSLLFSVHSAGSEGVLALLAFGWVSKYSKIYINYIYTNFYF
jgi:hypothetical protein